MTTLVCIGLGYCARHYLGEFGARFERVLGTTRSAERAAVLGQERLGGRVPEMVLFEDSLQPRGLKAAISEADALLVSAAPTEGRDPVLALLGGEIALAPRLKSVVYLSTLGVYGDSGGTWVDETARTIPAFARRGRMRIDAELEWQALGARRNLPIAILRLGGIYGPRRNAMVRLLHGTAHRIDKPGHVSNRVHVYDLAQAIDAAFGRGAEGIFNVVDDEPASPSDQVAFAAQLIGVDPPPEIPYEESRGLVSPMTLSFYDGCIRARNGKLKAVLGVNLRYPTYRDGLRALHEAGDHLGATQPTEEALNATVPTTAGVK